MRPLLRIAALLAVVAAVVLAPVALRRWATGSSTQVHTIRARS